jgi:hypothetical protein
MEKKSLFSTIMPPTIQDVKIYFSQKGMSDQEAEHFFLFYEKKQWKSKKGNFLKGWKNVARSWVMSVLSINPWLFNKNVH